MANELVSLENLARDIRDAHADLFETAVRKAELVGKLLLQVKDLLPHGSFGVWVENNCPFSFRSAKRFMYVARFPNGPNLAFLANNEATAAAKKAARDAREAELGAIQSALPDKKYGVIVADPEWRFEPWSRETGMDRAADNHYPTSELISIAERDVESIAADDCVLFLWATAPMIEAALEVMDAWGFEYKSQFVWVKDKIGTGYWNRNKHELLLVGTRGNIPAPAPGTQWPSAIEAPVTKHSAKPEQFLEMIEAYFPTLPKIEINRRGPPRPGWDAWGNECEVAAE